MTIAGDIVPFTEPPPTPAAYDPGAWVVVFVIVGAIAAGYFLWLVVFGGINRVRGGTRKVRTFLESALALVLVVVGAVAVTVIGERRVDDRWAEYDAVVDSLEADVEQGLERHYGIEFASYLYVPLSRTGEQPVEVRTDAGEQDCFVHVVGDRYAVSCGGVDAASSTELPAAD